jgi:pimeloyl-ACP methyl ester carboxylesterase
MYRYLYNPKLKYPIKSTDRNIHKLHTSKMAPSQKPPQRIEAPSVGSSKPATIIFLHGYGDDADSWISISPSLLSLFYLKNLK